MPILRFLMLVAIGAGLAGPAAADATLPPEETARLAELFADLKVAPGIDEGRAVERQIVAIWMRSGDAHVDEMMTFAIAAMNAHSWTLALNYLDTIVLTRPDYIEGWNKRAFVHYLAGDDKKSLADIDAVLKLEPRHFGALAGLGMIRERQGDFPAALEAYRRALELNPNLEDVKIRTFLIEDKLGKKA